MIIYKTTHALLIYGYLRPNCLETKNVHVFLFHSEIIWFGFEFLVILFSAPYHYENHMTINKSYVENNYS